jgi:aspartate/glutamate racemase
MSGKRSKVGFIHTTPASIGMVENYMRQYLPRTRFVHMYDGNVKVDNFNSPIGTTPRSNFLRFANFAAELEAAGCGVIASCCSLMTRATAWAKEAVSVPFVQLDAVILDNAVQNYSRIGVITTTEYVVPYIEEGLKDRATRLGKKLKIVFSGNGTALKLFNSGEFEKHDAIVQEDIRRLDAKAVDCILMGQIPFALMDEKLKAMQLKTPLLYAGRDAFKRIGELLCL